MHRSTIKNILLIYWICGGFAYAEPFSPTEKLWIDANPIVRFSIHEKYAPYLKDASSEVGVFKSLLSKLEECTKQQYIPVWRSSDLEGLEQLAKGQVNFMIDPPEATDHVLQFGSLSESIFWGYDAVITKQDTAINERARDFKLAYFDRGLEKLPATFSESANVSSSLNELLQALIQNDIEALVMPLRLANHLIQVSRDVDLKVDGLFQREPFAYRWLIGHQDTPLHTVLGHFLNDLDPIASRNLFSEGIFPRQPTSPARLMPWISLALIMISGGLLIYRLQRKYFHQKLVAEELLQSKELAEKANAAKSAFLATMSHEIRTPMNAILGVQELLLGSEQFPKKDKSLLKSAQASAESLLSMLNQVLDISKIEAGKLTLNLEPCNLYQLAMDIHAAFAIVAKKQNLQLHTSIDHRTAEVLMIDSLRLRQVLQNLLSNAIKFTSQGEVYLSITVLADDHAGQLIEFRVIDTGVGMGTEQIELALKAFEQVPASYASQASEQKRGTGLGLTITNHLVLSMNSHLYFESAPGFGSNVHFSLALPRTSLAAPIDSSEKNLEKSPKKCITKKFGQKDKYLQALVVEDHPASRQILSLQLEALGIRVIVCETASAALELFEDYQFDLMLTDQSMPGMQGSDLAKQIRKSGNRDIIIIGVTADIYALESRHQFLSAGMNAVLIKPLSLNTLENELLRYFDSVSLSDQQEEEYSFEAFTNLIKSDPSQILIILEEIARVHDDVLYELRHSNGSGQIDESQFRSLVHKVKGGAQLLQASRFTQACEALETDGPLSERIEKFIQLLVEQNQRIDLHKMRHQ
jgi:two-component system sensor histidine kinase EvgS